jgi:photosystem II stability/assembly factor-like uncharacterized protein
MARIGLSVRWLMVVLVFVAGTHFSHGQDGSRDQRIADLEKEIQALNKKLEEIKAGIAGKPAGGGEGGIPAEWIKALTWRSIGPASMGGRITAIAAFEADTSTYWVATASGGLVKTVNNGISFEHQFDREATVSIGDVCVAPSNKDIVWVGTGEANPRNSVSYGDGVYKSTDGGKTWHNMGLKKSFQIGRIKVHPKDPNIVYVGALGRLYGPNEERGLYKTTDGGKTWQRALYIDENTGIIDVQMHPTDPETLLVAAWDRERDEFDDTLGPPPPDGIEHYDPLRKYGKGAGIYKTTDGGKTFHKLQSGLPTCNVGRIGLDYSRKSPNTVFAIIDSEKTGTGLPPVRVGIGASVADAPGGVKLTGVQPRGAAARAGLKQDDVLVALDGKPIANNAAWIELLRAHKAGDAVKLTYQRGMEKKDVELKLARPRGAGGILGLGFMGEEAVGDSVVVEMLDPNGPAAQADMQYDDVVTTINGEPVKSFFEVLGNFARTHKAGDKVKLQIMRGTEKKELEVALSRTQFDRFEPKPVPGHTKRPYSSMLGSQRENMQDEQGPDGYQTGGIYKSTDGGETWARVNSLNPRPMYFSQLRVDPTDDNIIYVCGFQLDRSRDGGKTFRSEGNRGVHSDLHALWIDPKDGRHMILGTDGGFYQTYDRADHWDHMNHLALGQFYHVSVDPRPLYRVYGGLQDNSNWAGPSRTLRSTGPINDDWLLIGGGDGFVCRPDPTDPDLVYSESQGGAIERLNLKTGKRASLRPKRVPGQPEHRFNWNTPFILSAHNPSIFYCAGDHVFRSVKRGEETRIISPEITRTKKGSATALAESPRSPEVLWVGTDDGALWVTRDGGAQWTEISAKVGLAGPRCVVSIEPSRFVEGRAYVIFDAHRSNDDEPYIYVTEDYGQTWRSLRANLPTGSTRCCSEDIKNADLLYLGTEFGAWVSANRGAGWTKLNNNLPTVAVHEFAQHPTSGEIVAATHGRSLWVLDVTPLRQITPEVVKAKGHLYEPNAVVKWQMEVGRDGWFSESTRRFVGQNPPRGAILYYTFTQKAAKASLKVVDYTGKTVSELPVDTQPGMHLSMWDLMLREPQPKPPAPAAGTSAASTPAAAPAPTTGTPGTATPPMTTAPAATAPTPPAEPEEEPEEMQMFFGFGGGKLAPPGRYRVVLTVDGVEMSQWLRIEPDPTQSAIIHADEEEKP